KGPALNASLCQPTHLGLDNDGNLLIVDSGHQRIRRVMFSNADAVDLTFTPSVRDNSHLTRFSDGTWVRQYRNGQKAIFDQNGLQIRTEDPIGRISRYEYNADRQLIKYIDPVGQEITYSY